MTELAEDVRAHRAWLLSFIDVPADGTVVDLGAGRGEDLVALAARTSDASARFIGLDVAERSLAAAREAAADDSRISFALHSLELPLPFQDASVDAVYSNNALECVVHPAALAHEIARVLRPGGVVVAAHWDFDSQLFDADDKALVRRLVHAFADWQQPWMPHADGWMGRRLWGTFHATGNFAGTVEARVLTNTTYAVPWFGHARAQDLRSLARRGLASPADVERLLAALEESHRQGRYFYSITGYAYVGHR